jgi:hypothetical protein
MRSKSTQMINMFDNDLELLILGRPLILRKRWINYLMLVSSTQFPLTELVSNPIPVNNKQGTICVCMYFGDLNKACPKDNFLTPFIDQSLNECVGSEVFSFMEGFS